MRNDDALTAEEVADLLQVSRSTVYKLVKADELASYHVGRKMRFTMGDVENYIARAKRARSRSGTAAASSEQGLGLAAQMQQAQQTRRRSSVARLSRAASAAAAPAAEYVLAGNDVLGDIIANYLGAIDVSVDRVYEGSYAALVDMYLGRAQAALVHLYDAGTDSYNVAAVERLLPGMPVKLVRLVRRRQGLIVAKGNPKNLRTWDDLLRPGVRIVNRERGCGSRILLDEKLASLGADRSCLEGYNREAGSALAMASLVARGAADAGIGAERVYHQVEGVDFLPLQNEWLDMALAVRPGTERVVETIVRLARSRPFRDEVSAIVGYDATCMGEVVYERCTSGNA